MLTALKSSTTLFPLQQGSQIIGHQFTALLQTELELTGHDFIELESIDYAGARARKDRTRTLYTVPK